MKFLSTFAAKGRRSVGVKCVRKSDVGSLKRYRYYKGHDVSNAALFLSPFQKCPRIFVAISKPLCILLPVAFVAYQFPYGFPGPPLCRGKSTYTNQQNKHQPMDVSFTVIKCLGAVSEGTPLTRVPCVCLQRPPRRRSPPLRLLLPLLLKAPRSPLRRQVSLCKPLRMKAKETQD